MLSYREFKKEYTEKLGKGKKFNMKELNAAWNEYKKQETPSSSEHEEIAISEQPEIQIVQNNHAEQEKLPATVTEQPKQAKTSESTLSEFTLDELQEVAAALHETVARIIKHATDGKVDLVKDNGLTTINKFGARLLKKYDQTGLLEKYGLEISYGVCVVGIALETIMVVQSKKKETNNGKPQ